MPTQHPVLLPILHIKTKKEKKMNAYRFTTALDYTFAQLAEMHNISFSGYFFPVEMTPESIASFYRVYSVAPQHCVVMHTVDGAFVGLAKPALRGSRAWCAGFGIARGEEAAGGRRSGRTARGGGPKVLRSPSRHSIRRLPRTARPSRPLRSSCGSFGRSQRGPQLRASRCRSTNR